MTKLGMQKARTMTKEEFRATLPGAIGKIYGAVIAAYGPDGAEVAECFPEGRRVFRDCKNDDRKQKLQALVTALTGKVPPLAPGVLDGATDLLETWTDIYEAQGAAKGSRKGAASSVQPLRVALELELTKDVLSIALRYLCDQSKVALYFPQELLRNRAKPVTPGVTTLANGPFDGETGRVVFTLSATGAVAFRLYRRLAGEADWSMIAEEIEATDGAGTYTETMPGQGGTFEYMAEAVNGTRVGERSNVVSVVME